MKQRIAACFAALIALTSGVGGAAGQAMAQQQRSAGIEISSAWIQAPPQGAPVASGYMRIVNRGASGDRLLAISSPRAGRVEMHEMSMDGAVMRMRPLLYGVPVPANGAFEFSPSGAHVMFNNMDGAYGVGQTIPLRLTFQRAGVVDILVPVQAMGGGMHH